MPNILQLISIVPNIAPLECMKFVRKKAVKSKPNTGTHHAINSVSEQDDTYI